MKKILLIFLIITSVSYAQSSRVSLKGGASFPSSPQNYYDYWKIGYSLGFGFEHAFNKNLSLPFYFTYTSSEFNSNKYRSDNEISNSVSISGGEINSINLISAFKVSLANKSAILPYFFTGIGMSLWSIDDLKASSGDKLVTIYGDGEFTFSFNMGIGFDIMLDENYYLSIEGNWILIPIKENNVATVPLTIGFSFVL